MLKCLVGGRLRLAIWARMLQPITVRTMQSPVKQSGVL